MTCVSYENPALLAQSCKEFSERNERFGFPYLLEKGKTKNERVHVMN